MSNILKEMMIRMLQKQDYATVCLNENVKTLAEYDKHLAKSLDKLKLSTEKKIQDVTIIQGREIVKVNSSLDILKRQVSNVSISVDSLKKRHPTDSYKSTTLFSEPHSQMPYTISSSVSSLIRQPAEIEFPKPGISYSYAPFAAPSFFGHLKPNPCVFSKTDPSSSSSFTEWMNKNDSEDEEDKEEKKWYENLEEDKETGLNKLEINNDEPSLESLEEFVQNFSPQDKVHFNIPNEEAVYAATSISTWNSTWSPTPDRRDTMKSEYHKDWLAS